MSPPEGGFTGAAAPQTPGQGFGPAALPTTIEAPGEPVSASMTTLEFLQRILPKRGLYIIARLTPKGFRHQVCDTPEEAAAYALQFDTQGMPTYHACAAYRDRSVESAPDKDGKAHKQVRVQKNVRAAKAFWMDLDVKPGEANAFESQEAACDALAAFCKQAQLPIPLVVSSGRGIHVYWTLTHEINPDQWKQTAAALKAFATKLEFKADPACTSDPARILRPVGTWNRKDPTNPRPVELVADALDIAYEEFHEKVISALERHGVEPPKPGKPYDPEKRRFNEQFAVKRDFSPFSAERVADRCQQLRRMRDTKGCVPEPIWYNSICLMVHSADSDELIHSWSNGYTGYSREKTGRKIAQARANTTGPTLCATFEDRNPGGCDGCPFKGKINSPAQLGVTALEIPVTPSITAPAGTTPAVPEQIDVTNTSETQRGLGALSVPTPQDPIAQALLELNTQYAWVQKQKQIFRFKYQDFIEPAAFKIALANRPPVQIAVGNKDPRSVPLADAWLRWPRRREHFDIVYEPGKAPIFNNQINLWSGWGCEPVEGDIGPWRALLDEAFGKDTLERTWVEQWFAHQIQRPGMKLFTALVLWSPQQGVGKTIIGETFGMLFGKNFDTITDSELGSEFNEWVKGRQFILGEEVISSEQRAAINRLKHLITGGVVRLNEKNQPKVVLRNTINFMFTSNHPNAVHIDIHDRRFFVVEFFGEKLPDSFFTDLVDWRDHRGGLSALMHHLQHLPLDGFDPAAAAPKTRAKEEMMDQTRSDLERWVFDKYFDPGVPVASEVVYAIDLANLYQGQRGLYVTETAVGRALKRLGSRATKRVNCFDGRKQLRSIRRHQHWAAAKKEVWADEYKKGQSVQAQISAATAQILPATVPQSRH